MDEKRKSFRDMSFTEKLSHIWFYNKWHILCGLVFLVMIWYNSLMKEVIMKCYLLKWN